jgi:hypothetical protein
MNYDRTKIIKIDLHTMKTLQLLISEVSCANAKIVQSLVLSDQVFSNFDESERIAI